MSDPKVLLIQPLREAVLAAVRAHIRAERDGAQWQPLTEVCADAALAWFDARLGSGEVVRTVGVALMNNTIGSPAKGEPFKREDRRTEDIIRDAGAAVEAVRAALKEGE